MQHYEQQTVRYWCLGADVLSRQACEAPHHIHIGKARVAVDWSASGKPWEICLSCLSFYTNCAGNYLIKSFFHSRLIQGEICWITPTASISRQLRPMCLKQDPQTLDKSPHNAGQISKLDSFPLVPAAASTTSPGTGTSACHPLWRFPRSPPRRRNLIFPVIRRFVTGSGTDRRRSSRGLLRRGAETL